LYGKLPQKVQNLLGGAPGMLVLPIAPFVLI
jgi:hypothetical protein